MKRISKRAMAKLLDPATNEISAEGELSVDLSPPTGKDGLPTMSGSFTVDAYRPDLDRKAWTISCGSVLIPEVFLNIEPGDIPSTSSTRFKASFQGNIGEYPSWLEDL
jgi:hypothetical protein